MISPQLILDVNDEIFCDNFAGGGGFSMGYEQATGRHVDDAINHNPEALGMHRINHPQTVHHCESVFVSDPAKMAGGRRIGGAQGFPDDYVIDRAWLVDPHTGEIKEVALTKAEQIRMCGNSVPPPVAKALVAANLPEMAVWKPRDRRAYERRVQRIPMFA